jgi:glutamate-1-semialdehyde aminotransferase
LAHIGQQVRAGWQTAAERAGLALHIGGIVPLSHFAFDAEGEQTQAAHTLFTQLMLERGFLATKAFYVTYAHQDEHVERYLDAVAEVFGVIAVAVTEGTIETKLKGPVAHTGFQRLT